MGAQPEQRNSVTLFVIPNKQKITFNMTFKTTGIFSLQDMQPIFLRQRNFIPEHIKHYIQLFEFLRLIVSR